MLSGRFLLANCSGTYSCLTNGKKWGREIKWLVQMLQQKLIKTASWIGSQTAFQENRPSHIDTWTTIMTKSATKSQKTEDKWPVSIGKDIHVTNPSQTATGICSPRDQPKWKVLTLWCLQLIFFLYLKIGLSTLVFRKKRTSTIHIKRPNK